MAFVAISAGVGIAATAYNVVDSVNKNAAAKKLGESNNRAVYDAPEEIDQVKQLAASEVNNTFLEDSVYRQIEQSRSQGIDAILKSGGKADFTTINNTYGTQLTAALQMLYKDRDQKIATFNNSAYAAGRSKDAEFQYNEDAPFKDKKQQEALLRGQSAQAASAAFGTAASTVSNLGIAKEKQGKYGRTDSTVPEVNTPSATVRSNAGATVGSFANPVPANVSNPMVSQFYGGYNDVDGNWVQVGG